MLAPNVEISEGAVDIMVVQAAERFDMLQIFLDWENGSHIRHKAVKMYKVKSFELHPITLGGNLDASGQKIVYGPIRVTVHHGGASFIF